MSAVQPLIDYLEGLQSQGKTHVQLNEQAKSVLRIFYRRAVQPASLESVAEESVVKKQAQRQQEAAAEAAAFSQQFEQFEQLDTGQLSERFSLLKKGHEQLKAQACHANLRSTLIFPTIERQADIFFLTATPTYHEECSLSLFAGKSGEKLNGLLKAMSLTRQEVHLSTILKFRPERPKQHLLTRPAAVEELEAARFLLDKEIRSVRPKVIVSLGTASARFLTKSSDSLDALRGLKHSYLGIPLVTSYHPSFLLNHRNPKDKREIWEDMLRVLELAELPISAKQRGFYAEKTNT